MPSRPSTPWPRPWTTRAWTAPGGGKEEPKIPEDTGEDLEAVDPDWDPEPNRSPGASADPDVEQDLPPAEAEKNEKKKPEFEDGMSVQQAIAAVPSYYEYIGIDQDVLAKPLSNPDTYKPCKLTPAHHFTVKVAIWDGKTVGLDIDAPPAIKDCIAQQIKAIQWPEPVESINTIDYSF